MPTIGAAKTAYRATTVQRLGTDSSALKSATLASSTHRSSGAAAQISLSAQAKAAITTPAITTALKANKFSAAQSGGADIQSITTNATLTTGSTTVLVTLPKLAVGVRYQISPYGFGYTPGASISYSLVDASGKSKAITPGTPLTVTTAGEYKLQINSNSALSGALSLAVYGTASLPNSSGDKNIDAVLYGGHSFWQNISNLLKGIGPSPTGAEIKSGMKSIANGGAKTKITYGFLSTDPTGSSGFEALNDAARSAVRSAFSYFSNLINVTFQETSQDKADIAFGANQQGGVSNGYAYPPNSSPTKNKTYVMLAKEGTYSSEGRFTPGSYNWSTIIHETGHALGLKHPGNYNAGGGGGTPPYLDAEYDTQQYSMMSYNPHAQNTGVYYSSPMLYDIAALQYMYGAKLTGSTATKGLFSFNPNQQPFFVKTLYSKKTTDKIDLTGLNYSSTINLNAGTFSSVNVTPFNTNSISNKNNVAIAYGSTINNVKLSNTASEEVILNDAFRKKSINNIEEFGTSDKLTLSSKIFGSLSTANILIGAKATAAISAATKVIVDSSKGDIYFDQDGNGSQYTALKIAHYTSSGVISTSNFKFTA